MLKIILSVSVFTLLLSWSTSNPGDNGEDTKESDMNEIRYSSDGVSTLLITAGEPRLRRCRDLRIGDLAARLARMTRLRLVQPSTPR